MPKRRFAECDSCVNDEHDPFACDSCEDGSNFEPYDDFEEDSVEELTLQDFRGYFKVAA